MFYIYCIKYVFKDKSDDPVCEGENFFEVDFKDEGKCLNTKSYQEELLIIFYYISTTLSTVGLGDFHPKSDNERVLISIYMLFGYLIFSYLISEL